jgi:hypothetical protein
MILVALIHQGAEMVNYMVKNLSLYMKGKFLFIIHHNSEESIDENTLPEWCWIVRDPIKTKHTNITLALGVNKCLKFAIDNVKFINCMTLSSGCIFFRDYLCPTEPKICVLYHYYLFPQYRDYEAHQYPIPSIALGNIEGYFKNIIASPGHFNKRAPWDHSGMVDSGWIYPAFDKHTEMHDLFRKRNIKYVRGCQFSGQVFPYEVAKAVCEDLLQIETPEQIAKYNYSLEEIIFSSYSYDYSIRKGMMVEYATVAIDWDNYYEIHSLTQIYNLLRDNKYAYAVCKVPYDIRHPIREFLNSKNSD